MHSAISNVPCAKRADLSVASMRGRKWFRRGFGGVWKRAAALDCLNNGKLNIKELKKNRLTVEELLSQLRLSGYFEMSEISCAVLEPNGQISAKTFDNTDLSKASDISRARIIDGDINFNALNEIGRDINWLTEILKENNIPSHRSVFLLASNGNDKFYIALNTEDTTP